RRSGGPGARGRGDRGLREGHRLRPQQRRRPLQRRPPAGAGGQARDRHPPPADLPAAHPAEVALSQASLAARLLSVFSRREIGQFCRVPSAILAKASAVTPGTFATVSRWMRVTVGLPSLGSKVRLALVSTVVAMKPAFS